MKIKLSVHSPKVAMGQPSDPGANDKNENKDHQLPRQ